AFGVGTRMGVAADAPYFDMAYKLVAYDWRPVLKLSAGKATWPGPKQVWRMLGAGEAVTDCIGLATESMPTSAHPLLIPVLCDGRRLMHEPLAMLRERARKEIAALPPVLRALDAPAGLPVQFSAALERLRDEVASEAPGGPQRPWLSRRVRTS
ncbi:MAG: nicotinate phosphoribosyltransferase, partial [Chloroflexi bacterium]|nr:nicotinate phosphoribosyltransferase [Chloroflexota bacterium]